MPFTPDVPDLEPTPRELFFNRRRFLKAAAALGLTAGPMACGQGQSTARGEGPDPRIIPPIRWPEGMSLRRPRKYGVPEGLDAALTAREVAARHNNYYEFLPNGAGDAWPLTEKFQVDPWAVEVTGQCARPQTFSLPDLYGFEHEERIYHFRCVETWAMNVPWVGFPLARLLERVQPTADAKFVRFVTANRPEQMPGLKSTASWYPWPYHEGLRLDEAMHDLAMLVTGAYGEPLPKQHGAPVRLIVPWKYGYKSAKSIVKIELVKDQPPTLWSAKTPHEYGFLSNVNPNIPHPRWSQAWSYWLPDRPRRFRTPLFNGYDRYVGSLYPDEPRAPQKPLKRGQTAR